MFIDSGVYWLSAIIMFCNWKEQLFAYEVF